MSGTEFTVLAALVRLLYRRGWMGDTFGVSVPIDWWQVAACTVGVVGAVGGGWLMYGPSWLPWWASLATGFAAGGVCERRAESCCGRAESGAAPDRRAVG